MGSWCRPQNDGPGLRAITAMAYARQKPAIADRVWQLVKQNLEPRSRRMFIIDSPQDLVEIQAPSDRFAHCSLTFERTGSRRTMPLELVTCGKKCGLRTSSGIATRCERRSSWDPALPKVSAPGLAI